MDRNRLRRHHGSAGLARLVLRLRGWREAERIPHSDPVEQILKRGAELLRWARHWLAGLLLLAGLASIRPADAQTGDTLRLVRARGELRCGVSEGVPGFSVRDKAGHWSGLDVDFCRAVAAVVFGDADRVRFIPLHPRERFPALRTRSIDLLARNTTWSVQREANFSVIFAGVLYFDNQGFLALASNRFAHAPSIDGARVCVESSTNEFDDVQSFAGAKGLHVTPVTSEGFQGWLRSLESGTCDLYTDDLSAFAGLLHGLPDAGRFVVRPERIAKEPLGPAVRWNDGAWLALVRATHAALLDAEERGLTQAGARAMLAHPNEPAARALLHETDVTARALGIAGDWMIRAVAGVGNYREIFARNLGRNSPLKLDRGPNRPWTEGGLLFAPPLQ